MGCCGYAIQGRSRIRVAPKGLAAQSTKSLDHWMTNSHVVTSSGWLSSTRIYHSRLGRLQIWMDHHREVFSEIRIYFDVYIYIHIFDHHHVDDYSTTGDSHIYTSKFYAKYVSSVLDVTDDQRPIRCVPIFLPVLNYTPEEDG